MPVKKNRELRILHIFQYFKPDFTGDGVYWIKLNAILAQQNIISDVLALKRTVTASCEENNHILEQSKFQHIYRFNILSVKTLCNSFSLLMWILMNGCRYQIVHLHAHYSRYFILHCLFKLVGCRLIQSCTLNDSPEEIIKTYNLKYRPLVARFLKLIDQYVVISPKLLNGCAYKKYKYKSVFIPQGVRTPSVGKEIDRGALRNFYELEDNAIVLLFVGGICPRKDIDFLIKNHAEIVKILPYSYLYIVGPVLDVNYMLALKKRVADCCLEKIVKFIDYIEEPDSFYALADLFVFSSTQEGFGNVVIEAMMHKLPVVARRLLGVTDYIIQDNKTGFLFDNDRDYIAIVYQLSQNEKLRFAIGEKAQKEVSDRFMMKRVADSYADLYKSLQ